MAESIQFNSTELIGSTYIVRNAKADSFVRELDTAPRTKDDGDILIDLKITPKIITINGVLSGSSASDLQTKINAMILLFAGKQKNLDITPNGGTLRRYVATCTKLDFSNRDFYHISHCPYSAEFMALEGIGKGTDAVNIYNYTNRTGTLFETLTLASGSADQKPIFQFTVKTIENVAGISIENVVSADSIDDTIIITGSFSNNDVIIINCDTKTVTQNGVAINYYGKFPRFIVGANSATIRFGYIIIEQNPYSMAGGGVTYETVYDTNWAAQVFMVKHSDSTYRSLGIEVAKIGSPANDLTVTIEGDDAGKPDGSAIATFTFAKADVGSIAQLSRNNASTFSLTANTKYWIVCKTTDGDGSNYYKVHKSAGGNLYTKGNSAISADSGSTWTNDFSTDLFFYLYFGGRGTTYSFDVLITYYPRFL